MTTNRDSQDAQYESSGIGPLEFVTVVRLLIMGIGHALSWPINAVASRLPMNYEGSDRLSALKADIRDRVLPHLPEWLEHQSGLTFLVRMDGGKNRLDAVVDAVPDRLLDAWSRFGVVTMTVFVTIWGVILLAAFGVWLWIAGGLVVDGTQWALAFDWMSLLNTDVSTDTNVLERFIGYALAIPGFVVAAGKALVLAVIAVGMTWLVTLPLLPGLALHEFGHYAAIRHAGGDVDSYGLLLLGPVLGGAYVKEDGDINDLGPQNAYSVWAAGIANSVLWGTMLVSLGVVLSAGTVDVVNLVNGNVLSEVSRQPLASVFILVGGIDIANGFLNAIPFGPVDGGGFIETRERESWGFHKTGEQ